MQKFTRRMCTVYAPHQTPLLLPLFTPFLTSFSPSFQVQLRPTYDCIHVQYTLASEMAHTHDGSTHYHGPGGEHGHTHEQLDGPGSYLGREMPIVEGRDWEERAFTVGIGG